MNRRAEVWLRRGLYGLSFCLFAGAVAVGCVVAFSPPEASAVPDGGAAVPVDRKEPQAVPSDPGITRLAGLKMTRSSVGPRKEAAKPAAPTLSSLIRVKGIMDFGDPKTNEAIIENARTNEARSYRVGDTLQGIPAVVTAIDEAVTFTYEGKPVRLGVSSPDKDQGPVAVPGGTDPERAERTDLPRK